MQVERRWFADFRQQEIKEIRRRQELVVVVDLWAATTNIVLMLGKKPARLIIINDDKYKAAKNLYKDSLCRAVANYLEKTDVSKVTIVASGNLTGEMGGSRFLEEEVWPFIFAPKSDILPTAFVNSEGFVEVVDYGNRSSR